MNSLFAADPGQAAGEGNLLTFAFLWISAFCLGQLAVLLVAIARPRTFKLEQEPGKVVMLIFLSIMTALLGFVFVGCWLEFGSSLSWLGISIGLAVVGGVLTVKHLRDASTSGKRSGNNRI